MHRHTHTHIYIYIYIQASLITHAPPSKDVLTAEQRERRMREVEAEVTQLVGWGSEEDRQGL